MKKILCFCFIFSTVISAAPLHIIHYDPFKKTKVLLKRSTPQNIPLKRHTLKFTAVFNNKAYINGKFYGINSVVNGYKIIHIHNKFIQVKKHGKISTIPLIKQNFLGTINKRD